MSSKSISPKTLIAQLSQAIQENRGQIVGHGKEFVWGIAKNFQSLIVDVADA